MSPTDFKKSNSIEKAEQAVQNSINRFEAAMEHFAEKVEATSQKIHHVRDIAHDSKEKLMHFKEEVQATLRPFSPFVRRVAPYAKQLGHYSAQAVVKARRRPFLWLAVGVAGYATYKYFKTRSEERAQAKANNLSSVDSRGEFSSEFPYQ